MPPKKDKKKKDKKAKPMKRTQQQKGKGLSQKQTQIVNIHLAKPRARATPKPISAMPINMIRMNEYAQPLANVPSVLPMREPLKEVVAPSRLLYEGIPEATLYEPPSQAIPEASGYAINPMKPIANLPPSTPERPAGGARGRPRLSEEERAKREQFAQMVKKQKEEEKFIAKQKKAEEKERAKKSKKEGKTGGGVPANSDSGYEN